MISGRILATKTSGTFSCVSSCSPSISFGISSSDLHILKRIHAITDSHICRLLALRSNFKGVIGLNALEFGSALNKNDKFSA